MCHTCGGRGPQSAGGGSGIVLHPPVTRRPAHGLTRAGSYLRGGEQLRSYSYIYKSGGELLIQRKRGNKERYHIETKVSNWITWPLGHVRWWGCRVTKVLLAYVQGPHCTGETGKMAKKNMARENTGNFEILARHREFCLLKL